MQRSTANMIRSTPEVKRQTALQAYQAIEIAIVKVKRKHEACVQNHTARMKSKPTTRITIHLAHPRLKKTSQAQLLAYQAI